MTKRDKNTAAFLSLLLGWVGAHQFYLRKPILGLLFVFAFLYFKLPAAFFLGLVNAVFLLMMSNTEFNRRYNPGLNEEELSKTDSDWTKWNTQRDYQRRNRTTPSQEMPKPLFNKQERPTVEQKKPNPFILTGIKKYKEYDVNGAIEDFTKALEIQPNDISTHFNLACAYSLTEKKEKAFYHLDKAVGLGFKDFEKIKTHEHLAFIRVQPEFDHFEKNNFRSSSEFMNQQKQDDEQAVVDNQAKQSEEFLSQLNKLAELRQKGLITEEEYVLEKKKLYR